MADTTPTSTTANSQPPQPSIFDPPPGTFYRLNMPFALRLPLIMTGASLIGFTLGAVKGGQASGFRFRAENAHRLPTTQTGWYLYHKSKNYHIQLGGIKEGFRMGARTAGWTGVFFAFEEAVDRGRAAVVRQWRVVRREVRSRKSVEAERIEEEVAVAGNRDLFSTMLAGVGTAGAFSLKNRFPLPTAVRLIKSSAKAALLVGALQDVVNVFLRGRRLGYVEFIKRHTFGSSEEEGVRGGENAAAMSGGSSMGRPIDLLQRP